MFPFKQRKIQQKAIRDLLWYDGKNQKMMTFKGTSLQFDFNPKEGRVEPRVVVAEETVSVRSRNKQDVLDWFERYEAYNDTDIEILVNTTTDRSVSFDVPDDEVEDFVSALEHENFEHYTL